MRNSAEKQCLHQSIAGGSIQENALEELRPYPIHKLHHVKPLWCSKPNF